MITLGAATALGAGASLLGSLFSASSQESANQANIELARENRQWQEDMWNKYNAYNTPSAIMQRYRDAGLNPYLVQSDGGNVGSSDSVPQPIAAHVEPVNYLQGLGPAFNSALQTYAVDANVANQRADAVKKIAESLPELGKSLGWDNARLMAKKFLDLNGVNGSQYESVIDEQIRSAKLQNDWQTVQNSIVSRYGAERAATEIQQLNQSIVESVGRLGLMSAQSDEARARIRVAASEFARNNAEALRAIAEAGTVNALRDYVVGSAAAESEMKSYELGERRSTYKSRSMFRDYQESSYNQRNVASQLAQESTYHSNPLYVFMNEVFRSLHIGH